MYDTLCQDLFKLTADHEVVISIAPTPDEHSRDIRLQFVRVQDVPDLPNAEFPARLHRDELCTLFQRIHQAIRQHEKTLEDLKQRIPDFKNQETFNIRSTITGRTENYSGTSVAHDPVRELKSYTVDNSIQLNNHIARVTKGQEITSDFVADKDGYIWTDEIGQLGIAKVYGRRVDALQALKEYAESL